MEKISIFSINKAAGSISCRFERVDRVDNALEGQTQSLRQSLVLRFSPDTPFSTKTSSANGFAVA
ncbi:MAG: hypothetical protein PUB00_07400, partial [Clostridiales bacterium]|nr:hypothetical protein [Clostridiales bacterium]